MPTRRSALLSTLLLSASALSLLGCNNTRPTEFAPSCPRIAVRADAADITRYRPGSSGRDLTDLVLDGRINGFKGGCVREDVKTVKTVLTIDLVLARGPATQGRVLSAAYFVAVLDGGQIRDKQVYPLRVELGENQDQVRITGQEITLLTPVNKEKSAAAYDVVIGFQLNAEEIETNRRRGPR